MNSQSLFLCAALLLSANVAYGAGSFQRTRDGKTLVWNDSTERGEEATWSGNRDKNGLATGSGTLTWYKVEPTIVTGSNIPDSRRYAFVTNRCSGKMVRGKFKGVVTCVDANGKRLQATLVNGGKEPLNRPPGNRPRKKATLVRAPAVTAAPTADQTSATTSEGPPARATPAPTPAPKRNLSSAAPETPDAVPQQAAALAPEPTATRTSEQRARQPDAESIIAPIPTPLSLPKPSLTVDLQTVAALNKVYQAAVKANDIAIMDQILADDFLLVTDRGISLTKADLIKEARAKRTTYEHQEVEEGTQKVRVWRDTAVVTALLRVKGMRDQNPFDYEVWINETYVRTATGWRYVFGQASIPFSKADGK